MSFKFKEAKTTKCQGCEARGGWEDMKTGAWVVCCACKGTGDRPKDAKVRKPRERKRRTFEGSSLWMGYGEP